MTTNTQSYTMKDTLENIDLTEKLDNKKLLDNAAKCVNTNLSISDGYTKDILSLSGISRRLINNRSIDVNKRKVHAGPLAYSYKTPYLVKGHLGLNHIKSETLLKILIKKFIEKIKTEPQLINNLEDFIREINENGVPIMKNFSGTTKEQDKIQFNRRYIELMGTKLTNITQGFNANSIYVLRSHSAGIDITPNIETILEMYKNIAECYYNLAIDINKLGGGKKTKLKKTMKTMKTMKHKKTQRNKGRIKNNY